MPPHLTFDIVSDIKEQLSKGTGNNLSLEQAIIKISRLARYPFAIAPGDWFTTRPQSIEHNSRPPPRCREYLWRNLEPRVPADEEDPETIGRKRNPPLSPDDRTTTHLDQRTESLFDWYRVYGN